MQKSEKRRNKEAGVYQKCGPPPLFSPPLTRERKVRLIWGCSPAYPPPSFQAPFDEARPGQEYRWLQGRVKTSVFMVEGVLSIWVRLCNGGPAPGS